ncbi:hypothetical protein FCM35_KLT15330 [Carex littledalei]|uniref:Uncharacterized protein n=1 Tax=Carex littledalei TaxID=544730 RepID=A0A833RUN2_9POAL|nr:hypothetical protein FCM35_KLT15330 [Carex littledalei]
MNLGLGLEPVMPKYNPSNLDQFLKHVTPSIHAQYQSDVPPWGQPYFELKNLWEAYKEWSTYGLGVTLVPQGLAEVVQYYVPFLSGIGLYQQPAPSETMNLFSGINQGEEINSSSASCQNQNQNKLRNEGSLNKVMNPDLLYQYLEDEKPTNRKPFADKIMELADEFPELMTLKSCDLLPNSWFSISWYPIYRIPMANMLSDLHVSFLTFHSLSTPKREHPPNKILLPPFGLATYRYDFFHPIWKSECGTQHETLLRCHMKDAAINHMCLLQVAHPDLVFFVSEGDRSLQFEEKERKYIRR